MISIIIPTLNEQETIECCLRSLLEQTVDRKSYEIIIVDGGSGDRTREIAKQYADQIVSQKRSSIGGARGDGVQVARGEILVFTDADTFHHRAWLEFIQENLIKQKYDVCTGPVLFYEKNIRSELLQIWRKQYRVLHLFGFYWLIGSNMAIKREAYNRIQGHRDISLLEDYDLSVRIFKEGSIRCRYDPRQAVYTSARRITNLLTYLILYTFGYYHYHITKDTTKLVQYPYPDKMGLGRLSDSIRLNAMNERIRFTHANVISVIKKRIAATKEQTLS
jgi:glycosyltransferase involved in cell wall biosynthesis